MDSTEQSGAAADLYLDLFDVFASEADYLQSSDPTRRMLAETVIVGALSSALLAFAKGFIGRFGGEIAKSMADRIRSALGRGRDENDQAAVLEALQLLLPHLQMIRNSTPSQQSEERSWVSGELQTLGFPEAVASATAERVLSFMRNERDGL